ncbi:peptide ABC transporter substrate-binding protein [Hydrogenoanaerobacterium sp.]|uniref:peptide ABC transporter substrate-binding protein n=1 Tax=Hydrogenoanaerobacterium sp. TaxID=2953763 RepID=UPI00289A4D12|nr:peptide ABC transporter substrate-binding protein [Hydrogenoanaerobacterium sp.]
MKKLISALLAAVLLLTGFTACGKKDKTGYIVKYDLTSVPRSLDPQLAASSESLMVVENTFEGLLRQGENGELVPGVATDYKVSEDGLTYTFQLRTDAMWSDGKTPVTAHDFVFAFRRVVDPVTGGASASSLLCVRNAPQILRGELDASALGVAAKDDYTFVVTLETPNPFFAEIVTSAAAMPCNEEFFRSTKGRYGLEPKYLMFNGPFIIKSFDEQRRMSLRVNDDYRSGTPVTAGGVDLYFQFDDKPDPDDPGAVLQTGTQKLLERFYTGKTDAAPITYSDVELLKTENSDSIYSFENTVWGLAFNCNTNTYGNQKIRRALMLSMDTDELAPFITGNLAPAHAIVPSAVTMLDKPYREIAGDNLRTERDPALAKTLLQEGLSELEVSKLSKTTIICPDTGGFAAMLSVLQRQLQEALGIFINLEPMPMDSLNAKVRSGDYMLALVPLTAGRNNPDAVLNTFSGYSNLNITGYSDVLFDKTLTDAMVAEDIAEAAMLYKQAERMLMDNAVYLPLAFETSYYAASPNVEQLQFSPFSYKVFFKHARASEARR